MRYFLNIAHTHPLGDVDVPFVGYEVEIHWCGDFSCPSHSVGMCIDKFTTMGFVKFQEDPLLVRQ